MLLRHLSVLVLAGTSGAWCMVQAAEPLRLEEAVTRALAGSPALVAEAAELQAVQARAQREALPTPFVVATDLENVAGTGSVRGLDAAEATVRVERVIELGGKRAARQALGEAEIGAQGHTLAIARRDLASETTIRFIEVLADQQRLAFAQQRLRQAAQIEAEVARWVSAARNPESDLHAAQIAVADAELALQRAEHELASARATLAASWGALEPDFPMAAGDLAELPAVATFDELAARLPMSGEQQALQRQAETIAARQRLRRAAARPDVTASLGVRRLEAANDQALVMSLSLPLGSRSRAAHDMAEGNAQLAALQARREADRLERHQVLFARYQELNQARAEAEAVRERMLPRAEQALQFAHRGFEAGRLSFAALVQAQSTLFALRERAIEAAARYHAVLAEVQRLTATDEDLRP